MNILSVYKTYKPDTYGGMEETIRLIINETAKYGCNHKLFVLSNNPENYPSTINGIDLIRYPITLNLQSCPIGIQALSKFKRHAAWADIIHYHHPWPFADIMHLLSRAKKPSLMTYHSDIVRQKKLLPFYRPILKKFMRSLDCIITTSENLLNSSKELEPFKDHCRIIAHGLDEKNHTNIDANTINHWQKKLGNNFILFIGVLRYYKGLRILLEACKNSDIPIVIAGTGPEEKKLKTQAQQQNLNNVHFLGYVSDRDKTALLTLCRAVILPSHLKSEAFGMVLLEGAAFNKPLISTELHTGTSYINKNGETGFVVPPNDSTALQSAIEKLYNDKQLAEKMGKAAYTRFEKLFTAKKMGQSYYKLYQELLNDHHVSLNKS